MKKFTLVLTLILAPFASSEVTAHESTLVIRNNCINNIQGAIAWNYEGNKRWGAGNLRRLCAGTLKASEPGACFKKVMHGGINWGRGTQWKWKNALDLCAGTSNAKMTVYCFQGSLSQGNQWARAVKDCSAPKMLAVAEALQVNEIAQPGNSGPNNCEAGVKSINNKGNVEVRKPDGTVTEYFEGGMKTTRPNGESSTVLYSTQAPVAIPPGIPDQAHNSWLNSHSEGLLNILKSLVNNDQAAIDNYIAYEGNTKNIYEIIQLRRKTISLLLP